MKNIFLKTWLIVFCLLAFAGGSAWAAIETGVYTLCTSTSDLEAGAHYIIASGQKGDVDCIANEFYTNNRKVVNATVANSKITVASNSTIMTIKLGGTADAWTLYTDNYVGTNGYLASAASGSNNYCRVISTATTSTISFNDNAAVITLNPHTSRNILRYNSSSSCFACYSSGQASVYLYKKSGEVENVAWVAANQSYSNGTKYTSAKIDDNISLAFGDGDNDGKYYDTDTSIRLYSEGKLTVSASEGFAITNIVITYSSSGYKGTFNANVGSYTVSETKGTWIGESQTVVLTNNATTGHACIQKVEVTYIPSSVTEPEEPALSTMDEIFAKAKEVNGTETDVRVSFNNRVVSGVNGSNAYVTDGTKGFIIYKSDHNFVAGDVLSGTVAAKIRFYNGAAEFTNITSTTDGLTVTKGGSVAEQNIAIADLEGINTGALVAYEDLTCHINGGSVELSDGENVIVAYKGIMGELPEFREGKTYDVKGIFLLYGEKKEILPRTEADVVLKETINSFKISYDITDNGTIIVKNGDAQLEEGAEVAEGTELVIECTPINADYRFKNWQYKVGETSWNTRTVDFTYTMPSANVKFRANFEKIPVYTVAWSVNGTIVKTENLKEGADVTAPSVDAIGEKVFMGWVTTSSVSADEPPAYVKPATTAKETITYYAVFATQTGEGEVTYSKLTSNTFDANAVYVLAAEESSAVKTLHYFSSYTGTTANESWGVTSTDANDAIVFTLSGTADALKAKDASGNYIQALATGKFRMSSAETSLKLNSDGAIYNPADNSAYKLRYNHNSGSGGFRWYNNTTGTSAYFYKKQDGNTYSDYCTIVSTEAPVVYTVTFDAQAGSCDTEWLTEESAGAGVMLPAATCYDSDWSFAGWATEACAETSTAPALMKSGSTYRPTSDVTLYAVYMQGTGEGGTAFNRVTDISELTDGKRVVVVSNATNRVLTLTGGDTHTQTNTSSITETDGKYIWTLGVNEGVFTFTDETSTQRSVSFQSVPNPSGNQTGLSKWQSTGDYKKEWTISASEVEGCWIVTNTAEANLGGYAALYITNPTGSWGALNLQNTSAERGAFAMRIYAEGPSSGATYNSNPIRYFDLTISVAGYATYYNAFCYTMPENVVGKIMKNDNGVVRSELVYEAGDVVPTETPLLLKGEPGKYVLCETKEEAKPCAGNLLRGSHVRELTTGGGDGARYYKFSNGDKGYGWYYDGKDNETGAAFENGAHKAYLVVEAGATMQSARFIAIDDYGVLTGIEAQDAGAADGGVYDLQGRRVQRAATGMYIKNGKKVIF